MSSPYNPPGQPDPRGVAPYIAPGEAAYGQSTYPTGPTYGVVYPEGSQATLALVFGILSVVLIPLLGPFAWWIGVKERSAIDAGRRDPTNRGQAVAGWVLGIIGTVYLVITTLIIIGYIAAIAAFLVSLFGASY